MGLFSLGHQKDRYGVVIEIGSGSVLLAIVHSAEGVSHPTIVWSHRELAPLRNIESLEQSAKAIITALVNASMKADVEGRQALREYNKSATLTELQCSIAAPWSYTVTKAINYKQDEPFDVSEDLISELVLTAQRKTESELNESESVNKLGLSVVTRTTMDVLANGYRIAHPEGQKAEELSVSHASVVTQQYLIDTVEEMREKLFSETKAKKISFALMLYCVARDLMPVSYEVCLVDVTYEATEIGIVRDGTLNYCTHTPFGLFSLTREIASITNAPLVEVFGYLFEPVPYAFIETLPPAQQEQVKVVFDNYVSKLKDLFKETGDELSIPKRVILHTDKKTEALFTDLVLKASKLSTKADHKVTPITSEIIKKRWLINGEDTESIPTNDTALLLSAQFFHKHDHCRSFEHL